MSIVRLLGTSAEVRIVDERHVEVQRPRTTLKKSFAVQHAFGPELSTNQVYELAIHTAVQRVCTHTFAAACMLLMHGLDVCIGFQPWIMC